MPASQLSISFCLEFLVTNRNPDGGWGYYPRSPSGVEATAWALMALGASHETPTLDGVCGEGRQWLLKAQRGDGSWPAFPGQPQGCWVTSLASQALYLLGGPEGAVDRGLDWLVRAWPAEGSVWWRLRQSLIPSGIVRQDSSLRGWNWTPGTASWVEPTSHALLFLNSLAP